MSLRADDATAAAMRGAPGAAAAVGDRYRSLLLIGRGGMGSVEVALERATGGFERIVALKRLLPEQARDPRHKEMFLREARLAALLAHPNVVHAFAFGELRGELYLAMEYVEGEPLSRVLAAARERGGGLDPHLVAHVLAEVCDGLHAAHELRDTSGTPLNVVHRDLSPQNVMIAYEGHVKLLDFGVAKFDSASSNTKTGEVKGKMAYMSPEQAMGEPLDRRSDLWSLGAVLFECLAGQRMWGPGTDLEMMRKLALEEAPRLESVVPNVPRPLADLQARLVARDRTARPKNAREVAIELRAFAGQTGEASTRALMAELFGEQAARQRAALTQALEEAAPDRVDELRRSLVDSNDPHMRKTVSEMPRANADAAAESAVLAPAPRSSRAWIAIVGVIVVIGIAAAAFAMTRRSDSTASTTATATATATPTPTPTANTTSSSTSAATSTATGAETTTTTTSPAAPATTTPAKLPHPIVLPPATTATATSTRPHVDPKPF